jgi:HrpA-like RNA helicase
VFVALRQPSICIYNAKIAEVRYSYDASQDQTLTEHGRRMASLPLDPVFSHLLLRSEAAGCVAEALTAVSLLSSENIFLHPSRDAEKQAAAQAHKHFASQYGDLVTQLQVYGAWLKVRDNVYALLPVG